MALELKKPDRTKRCGVPSSSDREINIYAQYIRSIGSFLNGTFYYLWLDTKYIFSFYNGQQQTENM